MGGFFSQTIQSIRHKYFRKSMHLLMSGLDAAGKTTILHKIKPCELPHIPIIGYNIETVEYKHIKFSCFDVGGKDKTEIDYSRDFLSKNYYHSQNITALIWVIDSTDKQRITFGINNNDIKQNENSTSSKDELHFILNQKQLKDIPLLIFANKKDRPNAMDLDELLQKLDISTIKQNWVAIQTVATTGDNLYEGLDWLSNMLQKTNDNNVLVVEQPNNNNIERVTWFTKEKHHMIFENRKKTILFVSGWIRNIDQKYKLKISCNLTKLVHQYYQNTKLPFDSKYKYYG